MNQTFPKEEKLKSRKMIETLFAEGKSFKKFPIKIFYLKTESEITQATFAVPKRNFKLAVSRNRIKRQMREAYRLNKHIVTDKDGAKFAVLLLFIGNKKVTYSVIEKATTQLLKKLGNEIS